MQVSGLREVEKHLQVHVIANKKQTQEVSLSPPEAETHVLSVTQTRYGGSMA